MKYFNSVYQTPKRSAFFTSLISLSMVFLFLVAGCGGSGSGNNSGPSPFAGNWGGTWSDPVNNQSGTLTVTIATNGQATGSIYNSTLGNGALSGMVSNSGSANYSYAYPGATYTASCTLSINGSGHLVGNCNEYQGSSLIGTATVDLTKS